MKIKKPFTWIEALMLLTGILQTAVFACVLYVAYHFIQKYW